MKMINYNIAYNYARLSGLLEGTMTTLPYFVNTPGFKVTDPKAFHNFMKQLINEAEDKVRQEAEVTPTDIQTPVKIQTPGV
jgi:hypothetical protein